MMHHAAIAKGITSLLIGAGSFLIAGVVDSATHISLGEGLGVLVTAGGIIFYVSTRLQRLDDRIDAGLTQQKEHIKSVLKRLDNLPCNHPECPSRKVE